MDGRSSRSIFREELAISYPDHGHALWEPNPRGIYEAVQVGDVGFIDRGYFCRMFNALQPPPSNSDASDGPTYPPRLKPKNPNHICKDEDNHQDFCSHDVQKQLQEVHAVGPDDVQITAECSGRQGAFLHLPFPADRQETIARGDFAKWILQHIDDCLQVADDLGCDVNRMEDIILVTGRHLAKSWVSAAFSARRGTSQVSFRARGSGPSGVHFVSLEESGGELKLGPTGENLPENQCVFVQGYRVARILNIWPRLRAAGWVPDLHDPEPESDVHVQAIDIPSESDDYPDPLYILLGYIAVQASNCDMILVHDDDLRFMDGALRSDTLMEQIRSHAPSIQQVRCEIRNESGSEATVKIATVATSSQDLFEALHEDQNSLESRGLLRVTAPSPTDDDSSNVADMPALRDISQSASGRTAPTVPTPFIESLEHTGSHGRLLAPPRPQIGALLRESPTVPHSGPTIPSKSPESLRPPHNPLRSAKYVKNIGRGYRKQAVELVSICRTFAQVPVPEQTLDLDERLRMCALDLVDDALGSAAKAGSKTSKQIDEKFRLATATLSDYETQFRSRRRMWHGGDSKTVRSRMDAAREDDTSTSTFLNKLKETSQPITAEPTKPVEFLLHESLADTDPTSVKLELGKSSNLKEVLWKFSRFKDPTKRLTLKQNPHFYALLPRSPEAYGDKFQTNPIETFQLEKISVLADNPWRRVYLETTQRTRTFGNFWAPNIAIIFKDVCGKLEGESIVGEAIQDTSNLLYFEEPATLPVTTVTPTSSTSGTPILDWREPIRGSLRAVRRGPNVDFNIRISATPPSNRKSSYLAPSPIPRPPRLCGSLPPIPLPAPRSPRLCSSLPPIPLPAPRPPPLQLQIPAPSIECATPSSYRTAQNTSLSTRSPLVGQPPEVPVPPSPRAPPVLLPKPVPVVTPPSPSPKALAISLPQQQSTVVSLPTGRVTLVPQTGHPPSQLSWGPESRGGAFTEGPSSSRGPVADVPSLGTTITGMSWRVRSISGPHVESIGGGTGGQQPPESYPEHADATSLTPDPTCLRQQDEDVPDSQAQPQKRKRNWLPRFLSSRKPNIAP